MQTLVAVLMKTEAYFRTRGISTPRLDAELIMSSVLKISRMQLYLTFDQPLSESDLVPMRAMVRRRGRREPLAWILGSRGFYNEDFIVHPGVLVPRPDTEELVDAALEQLAEDAAAVVVDIGCGTGCVGLTLALERPELSVYSLDLSAEALACTQANVEKFSLGERVTVLESDLLSALPEGVEVDLVVSNPPYIPSADLGGLAPEVATHEPGLALDGGEDGLDVYRLLIPAAAKRARQGVLVEVGAGQAEAVAVLFEAAGLVDVRTRQDLGGHQRVVMGRCP
ncbi:MAG: release factor glutamine methyltransferase [Myxococcota bacterium]|jgi:release factor glutamine methyltransferase